MNATQNTDRGKCHKAIWCSGFESMTLLGNSVCFLRIQDVVLTENRLQMTSEFNTSDKNKTQKHSTQTPHHCPPSQNSMSHHRLFQGSWLALMAAVQRELKEKQPSSKGLTLQVLIGHSWEARKGITSGCGIRKSVPSSLELWRGFTVCGSRVSSVESCSWHPMSIPNTSAHTYLHSQVLPPFTVSTAQTNRDKS